MKLFQVTLYLDRESYNGFSLKDTHVLKMAARNASSAIRKVRRIFSGMLGVSIRNVSCYELESEAKQS